MKTTFRTLTAVAFLCAALSPLFSAAQAIAPAQPATATASVQIPAAQLPTLSNIATVAPSSEPTPAGATSYGMSWKQAWLYGGSIMWILLGISFVMVAVVFYLLFTLNKNSVVPRRVLSEVRNYLVEGDQNAARRICEDHTSPFSSVVLAALDCIRATQGNDDLQLLRDVVESEGARQAESMQSQTQLLLDLSAIAPMLGLLGTTLGMLKAFGAVAQDVMVAAKPVILAQGVSQAIITTIFGLIVAIPCMSFYAYFRRRASRMVGQLEMAAAEVITALAVRRN